MRRNCLIITIMFSLLFIGISCKQKDPEPFPIASLSVREINFGQILIYNSSQNATRYQWSFSDGQASTEKEPNLFSKRTEGILLP